MTTCLMLIDKHFFFSVQTDMDSTNIYAYISIIALIVCIPPAIIVSMIALVPLEFLSKRPD
jgi:hypothetical protein